MKATVMAMGFCPETRSFSNSTYAVIVVNVKINGDYNRNGNPADDPHKDDPVTFAGPKGFVILANNNDSDGDGEPDCNKSSGQYLIKANDVPDIYQFYVSKLGIPSNAIPSGMSVVIEVLNPTNGNTSADAVIFATCAVGSSGGTSLTFENDTGVVGKYFGGTGTAILGIEGRKHGQEVCVRVTVKLNGTIIGTDEMRVLVAPWLALANNSPVVKIYSGFGGDASFYSDMNALFGSGNITWTNTASWRQDEGEFGYTRTGVGQSTYVARPVVLDFNSTTTDFFHDGTNDIKSLISASRGWDDSARKDFEHQGGGVEVSIPDASHPYGRLILSDWYTNFAQYAFFQNQKVQGPPILLPVNWLLVGHVDEVMSIVPNGSSYIICVADLTNAIAILKDYSTYPTNEIETITGFTYSNRASLVSIYTNSSNAVAIAQIQGYLDSIASTLSTELGVTIIRLPVAFTLKVEHTIDESRDGGGSCMAFLPNSINAAVANIGGTLKFGSPDPHFDPFRQVISSRLSILGSNLSWIRCDAANTGDGDAHCSSNTDKIPPTTP